MVDNNNPRNDNSKKRSLIVNIILYVFVFGIVALMIVFFINPFNSNKSKSHTNINNNDITVNCESGVCSYDGRLAYILQNEYVFSLQTQVYKNDSTVHAISGYYYHIDSDGLIHAEKKMSFSGRLESASYEIFLSCLQTRVQYELEQKLVNGKQEVFVTNKVKLDPVSKVPLPYYDETKYETLVPSNNTFMSWLPFIIIGVVAFGAMWFMISRASKSMRDGMRGMNEVSSSRARRENNSKVRFNDVAGCDEVKAELVELVDYFKNASKYTSLGAKLPKGVLLVGPPGTGKTLLAKAVAGEAQVPFYSISGSDFVEMYVGVGASRVRDMFKTAKANAPCLVFIDEIDAVGRQRGAGLGGGNDEREQTLNQLLVEMDGFEDNSGIIIIAATNRADILDPALTRAGRFDRQITVDLPDKDGRAAIMRVHARNKTVASDVDFDAIASRTTGFSGADLANILNDAAILAVRARRKMITMADIDEAIDRSIAGPAKSNRNLIEKEKKQIAYHESGHAIIGIYLPYADKVQKVTIIPRGRTGGHVLMTPEQDHFSLTKNELKAQITGYLGGRTSEEIFFEDVSTGASNDIQMATRIAKAMVTEYGMSPLGPIQYESPNGSVFLGRDYNDTTKNFSSQIAYEIDKEVRNIIEDCHEAARKLLLEHKEDVILMAETLLKVETLTAEQIAYLLEHRELPPVDEHKVEEVEQVAQQPVEEVPANKEEFPYLGQAPQCDEFNNTLKKLLELSPQKLILIVENDSPEAKDYTVRGIKASITKFAQGQKYVILLVKKETIGLLNISARELGETIEAHKDVEVLLIEPNSVSMKNIIEGFKNNK